MHVRNKDKFNFFVPVEFEKGTDGNEEGLVKIKGVASSAVKDSDEETLFPTGFDYTPFLKAGILNYNHQSGKTSAAIVGEPTHAEVVNDGRDFYIEGVIYPNEEGKNIVKQARVFEKYSPNRRFGFSIEGQVIERDLLNPKKVLKARITGCAITAQPKNPNTLMSIVKGEYEEAFVDDEDLEKMDTEAMAPTMPESVEHSGKPKKGKLLTKAQVYESIISKYKSDNFVKSVNEKIMNTAEINQEALTKAYEILDGISKSQDSGSEAAPTGNSAPADSKIEKGADVLEIAKGMYGEGKTKDECVENMVRKGFGLAESQTAVESVISEAEKLKENGGAITTEAAPIVKAEDVAKLVTDKISKSLNETIGNTINPISETIKKGFGAVGDLFKSQEAENTLLKSEIEKLSGRIKAIEETPMPSKSLRNVGAAERFAKSEGAGNLPDGFREVSVSDPLSKSMILDELEGNFNLSKGNSEKEYWGDAMRTIEAVGLPSWAQTSPEASNRMKIRWVQ